MSGREIIRDIGRSTDPVSGHRRQRGQENRNHVGREMFRETNEISDVLISAASSPGVANEVRAIFRGQAVPMRRAGPLFSPPRPRNNNANVITRGPRFHRTVILLPYDSSDTVPRGAFRDSLITANLEANIEFRIGMDADAVRRRIVSTFQELGHLENVRDTPEFTYLWPAAGNRLHLDPVDAREARQLNARCFKAKWRSNRPVYIRPRQNLTTYREPQQASQRNTRAHRTERTTRGEDARQFRQNLLNNAEVEDDERDSDEDDDADADDTDDDFQSVQLPFARSLGGGNSVTQPSESTSSRQTSTFTRTATSTRPTSRWSTAVAGTTATLTNSYGESDADDTDVDEEFPSSGLLNSTSITSHTIPTDLEVINVDALPERDNIDQRQTSTTTTPASTSAMPASTSTVTRRSARRHATNTRTFGAARLTATETTATASYEAGNQSPSPLSNSGVRVDFQGTERITSFSVPIDCVPDVGRITAGPVWMHTVHGFHDRQAAAQQFANELIRLFPGNSIAQAVMTVPFHTIELQCRLDWQLLFVLIINDNTEPHNVERLADATDIISRNGYFWGANVATYPEGLNGLTMNQLPLFAVMHPTASGGMRVHQEFHNLCLIGQAFPQMLAAAVTQATERLQMARQSRQTEEIRRRQNEEFELSLLADQQRTRERQRHEEQQQAEEVREIQHHDEQQRDREHIENLRHLLQLSLPDEPLTGGLAIRIRNSNCSVLRRFSHLDTNENLYQAAFVLLELPSDNFTLFLREHRIPRNTQIIRVPNESVLHTMMDD